LSTACQQDQRCGACSHEPHCVPPLAVALTWNPDFPATPPAAECRHSSTVHGGPETPTCARHIHTSAQHQPCLRTTGHPHLLPRGGAQASSKVLLALFERGACACASTGSLPVTSFNARSGHLTRPILGQRELCLRTVLPCTSVFAHALCLQHRNKCHVLQCNLEGITWPAPRNLCAVP